MRMLYDAGRQRTKVRMLLLASLVVAGFALCYGWNLAHAYGLRPADGGVLAPLPVRLAWGIATGLVCIAHYRTAVASADAHLAC